MKRSFAMLLAALLPAACSAALSPVEMRIAEAAETEAPGSIALLEKLVNINSGTLNLAGVQKVGQLLRAEFERLGFDVRWIPMAETQRAGHLIAERKGTGGKLLKDDTLHKRLDELVAKFNGTIDKINSGQGTLGQFVVNPQLYESLNGATREFQALARDMRSNPKKFLTIRLPLF
jgi:hypothetical protein